MLSYVYLPTIIKSITTNPHSEPPMRTGGTEAKFMNSRLQPFMEFGGNISVQVDDKFLCEETHVIHLREV
jgi:hypothetical protein